MVSWAGREKGLELVPKGGMRELGCYKTYGSSFGLLVLSLDLAFVVYIFVTGQCLELDQVIGS